LAVADFIAFAPDGLTSVGGYPGDDEKGATLFAQVDRAKMIEDFLAAGMWLKSRPDNTGKLGAVGFCFAGGPAVARSGLPLVPKVVVTGDREQFSRPLCPSAAGASILTVH
jgi:dienelactone hydrolase